ncbi:MAG: helix-turn-helix domain-containing protein [Fibrobacteres bacterium]|nr:helix-turn-helix domain-containing protein [Fibrobacterota bacterium]
MNSHKSYLKSSEIAKLFNVDHSTVFLWVKKKQLKPIKTPGGNFRFAKSEVEKLFRETKAQTGQERRKHPRFAVAFNVALTSDFNGDKVSALLRDISAEGISVAIKRESPLAGNIVSGKCTELSVRDCDSVVLKNGFTAEIRHVSDSNDGNVCVGLLVRK